MATWAYEGIQCYVMQNQNENHKPLIYLTTLFIFLIITVGTASATLLTVNDRTGEVADYTSMQAAVETVTSSLQTTTVLATLEPWMITLMILGAFAGLLLSLLMVYYFVNQIRISDLHRTMIVDLVSKARYQTLIDQTTRSRPSWDEKYDLDYLEQRRREAESQVRADQKRVEELLLEIAGNEGERSTNQGPEQELEFLKRNIRGFEKDLDGYLSEESINELRKQKQEFEDYKKKILDKARQEAEGLVPTSLSVAGMGITGSFFIELTAIITIIFGIIILGLVGVLGTAEIAPILAAIAGYVLGKTTGGGAYPGITTLPQQILSQDSLSSSSQTEDKTGQKKN